MPTDDALTLEQYRRVLDEAARELTRKAGETTGRKVASATGAVFAALQRHDDEVTRLRAENAAMLEVVRAMASGVQLEPAAYADTGRRICGGCGAVYQGRAEVHVSGCPVTLARRIVAESEASR